MICARFPVFNLFMAPVYAFSASIARTIFRKHWTCLLACARVAPMNDQNPSIQALGGKARARKLTPEERSAIASEAAQVRWSRASRDPNKPKIPRATHESDDLQIGDKIIPCAVL